MTLIFSDNSLREFLNFRGEILKHFSEKGYECHVIAPLNCEIPEKFRKKNIHYIDIKLDRGGNNPIADFNYMFKLLSLYRKIKPDYIFHYTIKPNVYGTLAAKALRIKSCAMVPGLGYAYFKENLKTKFARFLYHFSLRKSHKIITLNKEIYNILLSHKIGSTDNLILLPGGEGVNLNEYK